MNSKTRFPFFNFNAFGEWNVFTKIYGLTVHMKSNQAQLEYACEIKLSCICTAWTYIAATLFCKYLFPSTTCKQQTLSNLY
jgi:hypothetical protein